MLSRCLLGAPSSEADEQHRRPKHGIDDVSDCIGLDAAIGEVVRKLLAEGRDEDSDERPGRGKRSPRADSDRQ